MTEFKCRVINIERLVPETRGFRAAGYRLVQISAAVVAEQIELTYSFDRESGLEHLRVCVPAHQPAVPSITPVYGCAFLYENELHDLFKVHVEGLNVDFHGNLYRTSVKFPFGSTKPPVARAVVPAPTAALSPPSTAVPISPRPAGNGTSSNQLN